MAKYYEVGTSKNYDEIALFDTEEARGLTGICPNTGKQHNWFLFPAWSIFVKEGGKAYCVCLDCLENSHL